MPLGPDLDRWSDVRQRVQFTGLLVGNGASCAVWPAFSYPSLLGVAQHENANHRLTARDIQLFNLFQTSNFEQVLSALMVAGEVNEVFGQPREDQVASYGSIQRALIEAVRTKHVPWQQVPHAVLQAIRDAIRPYEFVYSTNYDLLLYWAVMLDNQGGFKDYFWAEHFDPNDVGIRGNPSLVLYLHGGLHLYRTTAGRTGKRAAAPGANLLDIFGSAVPTHPDAVPLFVSEGTASDKLRAIYRSDYLSFSYSKLREHHGALCVFGHSLADSDSHIVNAIRHRDCRVNSERTSRGHHRDERSLARCAASRPGPSFLRRRQSSVR